MTKLNQIVAVVNGKKTECQKALTELHRKSQKTEDYSGLSRTYKPLQEDNETFPDENKSVIVNYTSVLDELEEICSKLFDVVAAQEYNNCVAKGDIVVDGYTILRDVPVSYLLFLEKQLLDIETFFVKLPTLDMSENWVFNENSGLFASDSYETTKTKKVLKHKVLYEATDHHPAQVEKWNEDVVIGRWVNQKFSGAIPATKKKAFIEKVKKLQDAVKFAREQANSIEAEQINISKHLFNYLYEF